MLTHRGSGCEAVHPVCPECGTPALNVVVPTILERLRREDVEAVALGCQACGRAAFRYTRDMFCDRCDWLVPGANERFTAEAVQPPRPVPPAPAPAGTIGAWGAQALSMLRRALASDDRDALDTAIELFGRIVRALPVGDAMRLSALSNLGIGLRMRAEQRHDGADADAAVRALGEVLDACPPDSPHRPRHSTNLGNAFKTRALLGAGHDSDLDRAADAHREAVAATPYGDRSRTGRLVNLAGTLRSRYDRTKSRADLDSAIEAWLDVLGTIPAADPQAPDYASEFMRVVRDRLEDFAYDTDVDAGFSAAGAIIAHTRPGLARRDLLLDLGSSLLSRYRHNSDGAAAETALHALREAAAEAPPGSRERATYLSERGLVLLERVKIESGHADLDGAVNALREAASLVPADDPLRPQFLSNLAVALRNRFERRGDPDDLDASVRVLREAADLMPAHDSDRPHLVVNLGNALLSRFEQHWDRSDIDEAIAMLRTPDGPRGRSLVDLLSGMSSLALALQRRYEQFHDPADLDEAVAVGNRAVELAPAAYPGRVGHLSNLGHGLLLRFERDGNREDLDSAITVLRTARKSTSESHLHTARNLSNLGTALLARFERDGASRADIDQAVDLLTQAAGIPLIGGRERAAYLLNLGSALVARHDRFGRPEDADAAIEAWQDCCALAAIPISTRMLAGRAWGELAARLDRWPEAVRGYAVAVESLPLLAWRGVGRDSREHLLTQWRGLASDAAACAIAASRPELAVELLDLGRGVLWSQLLDLRTEIDDLTAADPRLAAELDSVRARLVGDGPVPPPVATPLAGEGLRAADSDSDRRIDLARRWDALIDRVRALPGFHDFARSPGFDRLRDAAGEGTVAVVNISRWRCDALLLTRDGVRVRRLDRLDRDEAWRRADTYLSVLQASQHPQAEPGTAPRALERVVTETLTWLWDAVAEPVLSTLGHSAPAAGQPWPRLWWCPTGPLAVLPLHAAGHHRRTGQSVLDRVVSSYTPTLRALITSRRRPAPASPQPERCLLIALQNTPGQAALPAVAAEKAYLTQLLGRERLTALVDADATKANILDAMASHSWVHATCHGDQKLDDPSTGGLVPHDWQHAGLVRVLELNAAGRASGGEFACLSACKTATGGVYHLDESISLVSALQYGGWRHVIGTLWSVGEASTAEIMFATYRRLLGDGGGQGAGGSAVALHEAIRAYRDRADHRDLPSRWAFLIHSGP